MSELEEEYQLEYFEEEGFVRSECPSCGAYFWTRDHDRETCGEPPCEQYDFIGEPGFAEEYTLSEMRETFLSFFEAHDHERIDPYPVAANRWRDDVLLTQASIYDFQPLVTSGETPPPANPLTVSQPCIRMQDIDNVGKTGRHTMAFEMMAHHAFNVREDAEETYAYDGEVYWKDRTVELCDELLDSLGADIEDVTYIEDPWVGGGNAGPAIEVIYKGLELATLVFMCMEQDPEGEYELKDGNRYSYMDTYIVDTGYGLERWTWMSQGTPTVYEAVYPEMLSFLKENAGLEYTPEETDLVARAARLSGQLDIDDVDDVEAARGDIADELDVDVTALRELVEPLERFTPSPTTAGRSPICSATASSRRTSRRATSPEWCSVAPNASVTPSVSTPRSTNSSTCRQSAWATRTATRFGTSFARKSKSTARRSSEGAAESNSSLRSTPKKANQSRPRS